MLKNIIGHCPEINTTKVIPQKSILKNVIGYENNIHLDYAVIEVKFGSSKVPVKIDKEDYETVSKFKLSIIEDYRMYPWPVVCIWRKNPKTGKNTRTNLKNFLIPCSSAHTVQLSDDIWDYRKKSLALRRKKGSTVDKVFITKNVQKQEDKKDYKALFAGMKRSIVDRNGGV